jgi:hypothetical protein
MTSEEALLQRSVLPADLTDDQFIVAIEELRVDNSNFHHRDHIRLAWAYLRRENRLLAEENLANCIRRFATHNKAPRKYHHTLTLLWVRLVAAAMRLTPTLETFEPFAAAHPFLFDVRLPWTFYSAACLDTEEARAGWVEPDLYSLP